MSFKYSFIYILSWIILETPLSDNDLTSFTSTTVSHFDS